MGKGDFRPLPDIQIPKAIFTKVGNLDLFPEFYPLAKFNFDPTTWVVWVYASLPQYVSFRVFFLSFDFFISFQVAPVHGSTPK